MKLLDKKVRLPDKLANGVPDLGLDCLNPNLRARAGLWFATWAEGNLIRIVFAVAPRKR